MSERLTARQREALDLWSAYLYRQGYTTRQIGIAVRLSASAVSLALARQGLQTRHAIGRKADLPANVYADTWRASLPPPGVSLAAGSLNQNGLLTSALRTWQSRNALSVFAHRVLEATDAEKKDGADVLEQTIAYAAQLREVLTDPDFAKKVRADPSYRDDIGHRFS